MVWSCSLVPRRNDVDTGTGNDGVEKVSDHGTIGPRGGSSPKSDRGWEREARPKKKRRARSASYTGVRGRSPRKIFWCHALYVVGNALSGGCLLKR